MMLKVRDIPYKRFTIEEAQQGFDVFSQRMANATSADEAYLAHKAFMEKTKEFSTAASLSNCRFTLNTADEFYQAEKAYYDETGPLFQEIATKYADIMLESKFRKELEEIIGPRVFQSYEIAKKTFSEDIIPELQEENALVTEYSKLMAEMSFEFQGQSMPLSMLRGYLSNASRECRCNAANAIGNGLAPHAAELDSIFDKLVKVRNTMALKMGYKSFTELAYYRMGRLDYNMETVAKFRQNVVSDLVPAVKEIKNKIKAKLGLDKVMFYDDAIYTDGEAPNPILDADGIFSEAQKMYDDMNPEIGDFMRSMLEAEAFDVIPRKGKWGGGYCTCFELYRQPFILANFNGTSDDIDVITHEFGHAFAASNVFAYGNSELGVGGMETAECHSMSMEFLCWKYMDKFFGKNAVKYRYKHILDALSFIPYGCIVDEFQHIVYDNPDMSPAERKAAYLELESKYRPYLSLDGIPYLSEGTRWQYQMHIFESPFYYIDYCLAQTVAIGFLAMSLESFDLALDKYIAFSRAGGTKPFPALVEQAGLVSPFETGALSALASKVLKIVEQVESELSE